MLNEYFLQSNELNALFNMSKLVTQMVKTLGNILYFDKLENSLQLKPYETIFIALPGLYEEYCKEEKIEKKDIKKYLMDMEKYYWVCINSGTKNESNLRSQAQHYEKYYKRMEPDIFKETRARTKVDFEDNLKNDILAGIDN